MHPSRLRQKRHQVSTILHSILVPLMCMRTDNMSHTFCVYSFLCVQTALSAGASTDVIRILMLRECCKQSSAVQERRLRRMGQAAMTSKTPRSAMLDGSVSQGSAISLVVETALKPSWSPSKTQMSATSQHCHALTFSHGDHSRALSAASFSNSVEKIGCCKEASAPSHAVHVLFQMTHS